MHGDCAIKGTDVHSWSAVDGKSLGFLRGQATAVRDACSSPRTGPTAATATNCRPSFFTSLTSLLASLCPNLLVGLALHFSWDLCLRALRCALRLAQRNIYLPLILHRFLSRLGRFLLGRPTCLLGCLVNPLHLVGDSNCHAFIDHDFGLVARFIFGQQ